MTPGRHVGRADRAEQQRVEAAPLVEHVVGQDRAVPQVAGAAEVVVDGVELDARRGDDLEGLGDDLGADAVASDHSNPCAATDFNSSRETSSGTEKPPTEVDGQQRTPVAGVR